MALPEGEIRDAVWAGQRDNPRPLPAIYPLGLVTTEWDILRLLSPAAGTCGGVKYFRLPVAGVWQSPTVSKAEPHGGGTTIKEIST
jgi:hypothetical protein